MMPGAMMGINSSAISFSLGNGGGSLIGNSSVSAAERNRKTKVFTPVTVKMVSKSLPRIDDVCEYDGDPINDIILVGRILRRIEEPMRT